MFWSRYRRALLVHGRITQYFGTPRDWMITPQPGPALDPPQIVHHGSSVVCSGKPGVVYVIEWTGATLEQHHVDV